MIIAVNTEGDEVGGGLGRAATMAVADVQDGQIVSWTETPVGWDVLHDDPTSNHGAHHARIAKFMKDNKVEVIVSGHIGPPMAHTLGLMQIHMFVGAEGLAREAVLVAAAELAQ